MQYFAHTEADLDVSQWQDLRDHLSCVGALSQQFAPSALCSLASTAGRWHDLGKYQNAFQLYLGRPSPDTEVQRNGYPSVPHSAAGAALALERFGEADPRGLLLALAIQAHHGALKSGREIADVVRHRGGPLLDATRKSGMPAEVENESPTFAGVASALTVRMLFSALVDADLLDTERWDRGFDRDAPCDSLEVLADRLSAACAAKSADSLTRGQSTAELELAGMRQEVYASCLTAAERDPGVFTLTVPTGGGKTLSGLAFALRHAILKGLRRVIVVAPYTSILEQTARVYRQVLGEQNVVEHHSNLSPKHDTLRNRQASENWDAPVVVTTNVQLLESLHAAHKRECRKLHRIAASVVLLDEVQTFPSELLKPIHAVLNRLVADFGASVVHMTATQPLLTSAGSVVAGSLPIAMTEIMPDPRRLFAVVRGRFKLERLGDLREPLAPELLAASVAEHRCVLAITHRRQAAAELAGLLGAGCLHLSAAMCAEHRTAVLDQARRRLAADEPCILVATQLIEAGVDIDFPVVFRALAGLETLAQAAGRCNREMRLPLPGRFIVYRAGRRLATGSVGEWKVPRGSLELGMRVAETYFEDSDPDLQDPDLFPRYALRVFSKQDLDKHGLLTLEEEWDFPEVAARFKMIEEAMISVVAPYGEGQALAAEMRRVGPTREGFRSLQRYTVGLRLRHFESLFGAGWLEPLFDRRLDESPFESTWVVRGEAEDVYHPRFGFLAGGDGEVQLRPLIV